MTKEPISKTSFTTLAICLSILSSLLFAAIGYVFVVLRRLRMEKMQKMIALEKAVEVTEWTKKIIIEKQNQLNSNNSDALVTII